LNYSHPTQTVFIQADISGMRVITGCASRGDNYFGEVFVTWNWAEWGCYFAFLKSSGNGCEVCKPTVAHCFFCDAQGLFVCAVPEFIMQCVQGWIPACAGMTGYSVAPAEVGPRPCEGRGPSQLHRSD